MAESALDKRKDQTKREQMSVRWPEEMKRWWLHVRLSSRRTMVGGGDTTLGSQIQWEQR